MTSLALPVNSTLLPLLLPIVWSLFCSKMRWNRENRILRARSIVKVGLILVLIAICVFNALKTNSRIIYSQCNLTQSDLQNNPKILGTTSQVPQTGERYKTKGQNLSKKSKLGALKLQLTICLELTSCRLS